ncbi:MAG: hypothetical protein N2440_04570 [Actinobacteria bacterium]|nr:hypothetical protein [Actinomycetota bacterium]
MGEKETFEEKSQFFGSEKEWLKLIKTIVAMSNRSGGRILYKSINVDFSEFDPANLDNKVNSYIAPKLRGIECVKKGNGVEIKVPRSDLRPHIFIKKGIYRNKKGNKVAEFYEGQIWIRHSSKNELLDKSDFDQIVKEEIRKVFERMNIIVAQYPASILEASESALPMKIKPMKDRKKGVPVVIEKEQVDPNIAYPYQAKDLARLLNKNLAFIVKLLKVLQLKEDPKYNYNYKNSEGKIVLRKYNDECLEFLRRFLINNPNFYPWRDKP